MRAPIPTPPSAPSARRVVATLLLLTWLAAVPTACGSADAETEPRAAALTPEGALATLAQPRNAPEVLPAAGTRGAPGRSSDRATDRTTDRTMAERAARLRDGTDVGATVRGTVVLAGPVPPDTLVRVTHDAPVCRPHPDAPWSLGRDDGARRDGAAGGTLGDAVVWLVPEDPDVVPPADDGPRRATVQLADCRITPRIVRAAQGATLLVRGRDAMDARLRFVDVAREAAAVAAGDEAARAAAVRAIVPLQNADVVVPSTEVTAAPGLVAVRDDRHPWVRGWIVVAPHRWVRLTEVDGTFSFDGVPAGRYTVVAWHERLGVQVEPIDVAPGVPVVLSVTMTATR